MRWQWGKWQAPAYVRTVTNILDECIALRVEQREYLQQKASMEKLVEGMQELLASYQAGLLLPRSPSCRPPTTIACAPRQLFNNQGGKQAPCYIYSFFFLCSLLAVCQSWRSLLIASDSRTQKRQFHPPALLDVVMNACFAITMHLFHEKS
jgi:hypothetical protein